MEPSFAIIICVLIAFQTIVIVALLLALRKAAVKLEATAEQVGRFVQESGPKVDKLIGDTGTAMQSIVPLGQKLEATAASLNAFVVEMGPKLGQAVDGTNEVVRSIKPIGEQLVDISLNIRHVTENLRDSSETVAAFIEETGQMARRQVSRVDNIVTDTVKRTQAVVDIVTDTVMTPVQEISAILSGVRTALGYLRGRRPHRDREKFVANDEMRL